MNDDLLKSDLPANIETIDQIISKQIDLETHRTNLENEKSMVAKLDSTLVKTSEDSSPAMIYQEVDPKNKAKRVERSISNVEKNSRDFLLNETLKSNETISVGGRSPKRMILRQHRSPPGRRMSQTRRLRNVAPEIASSTNSVKTLSEKFESLSQTNSKTVSPNKTFEMMNISDGDGKKLDLADLQLDPDFKNLGTTEQGPPVGTGGNNFKGLNLRDHNISMMPNLNDLSVMDNQRQIDLQNTTQLYGNNINLDSTEVTSPPCYDECS